MTAGSGGRRLLWWGRSDPEYSRNRILLGLLEGMGWRVESFRPRFSRWGDLEARLAGLGHPDLGRPDLVWVPCFRQRDMAAAARWARARKMPLVFDPLISAYDKQVFERGKLAAGSAAAERLRRWEAGLMASADLVIADTKAHADFFSSELGVDPARLAVIPVGAEEGLFEPTPLTPPSGDRPLEVLFYGSFIGLQDPECIVRAALAGGEGLHWTLLGDGPLRGACEALSGKDPRISFEPPVPLDQLPARIAKAHLLLGVFGKSDKAGRVIPNKVYQALACGRPIVTRRSQAYPKAEGGEEQGLLQIEPADPRTLAETIGRLADDRAGLAGRGAAAAAYYRRNFSKAALEAALSTALAKLGLAS